MGLIDLLVCFGSLVLGILSQISIVGNRLLNPLNQTWALDPDTLVQLVFKRRVTRGGHGKFSHRFIPIEFLDEGIRSRKIYCSSFEVGERAVRQGTLMSSAQNDAGGLVCFEGFLPAGCT